ncbi:unnamed protein product [Owenia fusiformis]|uniref:Carboxylic ester hydrolase n=1 Tax=Owenia fusiformis TaxID=6347 RepID=A0A8J1Y3D7_OWEFU|nr:unnamed protein product [Owenia fusiformis]
MGSSVLRIGCSFILCCLGLGGQTTASIVTIRGTSQLRGTIEYAINSTKPIQVFRAVPYAKPPVDAMRFKAPEDVEWWNGERNASGASPICPQQGMSSPLMKEDCLTLDIYTPTIDVNASLAIQIWIHGGAFKDGSSSEFQGIAMATYENVIFISINYRLGILGFLTSNSSEAPGNQGLWDQRQAFMWVKENIKPFGGDPNKITISGESAGSIAVSAHILSPKTEGLFEQAISQSGTATAAARVSLMKQELPKTQLLAQTIEVAPTFMYRFAHRPSSSTRQQWASAGHADEIQYTQGDPFVNHGSGSYTENEKILSGQIMRYWANFIKSGSPNSEDTPLQWSRFDCKEKGYLNIEQDGKFTSQKDYNVDRMFAWAETIPKLDSFRKNNQTTWKCDSTDTSRGATLFSFNIQCVLLMVLVDLISWL